ncbi:MAG: uroporphyrinogen decarboxylase family protein [Planctomycetota bacterium]|jgi:[methyl-Co(III) methanol-specific corrinoid protein]:coenzyme M methyltransferase
MTRKERLLSILDGRDNSSVAVLCPGGMMSMAVTEVMQSCAAAWPQAHSNPRLMAGLALAMHRASGFDSVAVPFCMTVEAEVFGAEVDVGSMHVQPRVAQFPLDVDGDFAIPPPDWRTGRAPVLEEALRCVHSQRPDLPLVGNVVGPFSLLGMLADPLKIMRWTRRRPALLKDCVSLLSTHIAEFAARQASAGADIICIAEPTATGEILGGAHFAEFVLDNLNSIAARLRTAGARVIMHICGDVKSIENELMGLEADAVSFDAMVDVISLVARRPPWLVMGNVSAFLLATASPAEVHRVCRVLLDGGVRLIAPACGIVPSTSAANLSSMSAAVYGTSSPAKPPRENRDRPGERGPKARTG